MPTRNTARSEPLELEYAKVTAGDLAAWAAVVSAAAIIAAKVGAMAKRAWSAYKSNRAEDQLVRDTVKAVAPLQLDKNFPKVERLARGTARRLTDHIRRGHRESP
jgi:hypothetical protein